MPVDVGHKNTGQHNGQNHILFSGFAAP